MFHFCGNFVDGTYNKQFTRNMTLNTILLLIIINCLGFLGPSWSLKNIQLINIKHICYFRHFPYLRSFIQRICISLRPFITFRNKKKFYTKRSYSPHSHPGTPPLVYCPQLLIQYTRRYIQDTEAVRGRIIFRIDWVTLDGVWICNWIYWILTDSRHE